MLMSPCCCREILSPCCRPGIGLNIGDSATLTLNVTLANPISCPLCSVYPSSYSIELTRSNSVCGGGLFGYSSAPQSIFGVSTSFNLCCGSFGAPILTSSVGGYGLSPPTLENPCPLTGFFIVTGFSPNPGICQCFYEGTLSIG